MTQKEGAQVVPSISSGFSSGDQEWYCNSTESQSENLPPGFCWRCEKTSVKNHNKWLKIKPYNIIQPCSAAHTGLYIVKNTVKSLLIYQTSFHAKPETFAAWPETTWLAVAGQDMSVTKVESECQSGWISSRQQELQHKGLKDCIRNESGWISPIREKAKAMMRYSLHVHSPFRNSGEWNPQSEIAINQRS